MTQFPALATIADAAKLLNVSAKTLRRWEARGILVPIRSTGGHRRYDLNQVRELKGNRRHLRLSPTPKILEPRIEAKDIPVLYDRLHIDQKRIIRFVAFTLATSLIIFTTVKLTPESIVESIKSEVLGLKISQDINKSTGEDEKKAGAVLAAATGSEQPTFNINIESAFKDNALFTQDVEIDGDLTLQGQIIGNVDTTGVVIIGGNSITTSQSTFNLLNTTATTLNIGGAATDLSLGAATGTTTVNNDLAVDGTGTITGNLSVTGTGTITGKITGSGDLAISGNATFGNITSINGVTYSFPSTQGGSSTFLTNNGSGTLTWSTPALTTFSGVLPIANGGTNNSTAYTAGSVIFSNGTKLTQDNSNLFYDDTNNRLGIGNSAPTTALDVTGIGTFSSGLTLTTGALNLTSTSGIFNLTSTAASGNAYSFTDTSLTADNSNAMLLTFQNANTGAGTLVNGLRVIATGSTPSSGTNTENLISLSGTTLGSNTFNGIYFNTGLSNFVNSTNWEVTAAGAETLASDLGVNGGSITTTQTIANIFNATATTLNIGGDASINLGSTTGTTTTNGNTTLGNATTDNITFTARVAQDSDLLPIGTTGTNDLGSALLPWDNVYVGANGFNQNGNLVCDASGANCPGGSTQYWGQSATGALYPLNSSVDILIGGSATTSAKFAFKNVLTGVPTASISGTTAFVSSYLTGEGNLATTNFANLTIGGATTGNITLNPSNSISGGFVAPNTTNVTDLGQASLVWRNIYGTTIAGTTLTQGGNAVCDSSGANCPAAGSGGSKWRLVPGAIMPFTDTLDVLIGSTATSSAKFAFKNVYSGTPTASISGTTAFVSTFLTGEGNLATTNFANLTIGGGTTGNITLNPSNSIAGGFVAPNTNNVTDLGTSSLLFRNIYGTTIYQGTNQVCDSSGNCPGGVNQWQLNNKILSPGNSTYDLAIGGTATGSAFQVFGLEKAADTTSRIAKINSSIITTGTLFEATASAITSGNIVKLGTGGDNGNFTGNGIYLDFDNTGGNSFTGNFLKFDNATSTKFTVDSSGNIAVAAGSGIDTLTAGTLAIGTTTANAVSISKSGVTTTVNGALTSSETLTASNGFTLTTGALNLTSTSGTSSLTSTATSGDSFAFTNNSLSAASANLASFTLKNNNTGAGVAVGGIKVSATGSTPSGGTNTANLLDISATALANNTFNGINFGNGLTNYINGANFTVTAAGNVSALGGMTVSGGTINLNYTGTSSTNIGNTTGTTTVAGNILPATTDTSNLGSSALLQFNNIYANAFLQDGNTVCDSTGTGCPTGASGGSKWKLSALGTISPFSDSLDVLIGNSATTSAKFAFKNVLTGVPTASISGNVANVATYIDGNGNIATTNTQNLVLGNSTTYPTGTGNILLNPNGTGRVGIGTSSPGGKLHIVSGASGGTASTNADDLIVENSGTAGITILGINTGSSRLYFGDNDNSGVGYFIYDHTDNSLAIAVNGAEKLRIDSSGNLGIGITVPNAKLDVAGTASVSGTLTVGNGTTNTIRSPFGPLNLAYKSAADTWTTGLSLTDTTGDVVITKDLAVNDGDITTSAVTATLFNTTATTLSLGGAATTALNLGAGNTAYTAINLGTGTGGNVLNIANNNTTKDTLNIGSALDDVIISGAGTGSLINFANFDVATTGNITVASTQGIDTNAAGTLAVGDTTATTVSVGSTAATTLNLGAGGALTRAINIGTGTGADTISIGTGGTGADTITIGNNASTTALNFTSGTGAQTFASSVVSGTTTTSAFVFTGNALTTGTGMYLNSSSITTGTLLAINATGTTLTTGKLFDVQNNSSSVFNIGASQITSVLPHQFTAAGDVTMAYDLVFTNQTASTIDSYGPLTVRSGESFESNNLTLKTYNSGNIVFDTATAGKVLIGTGSATLKFTVSDSQAATASAMIENMYNGSDADGLAIKLGYTGNGAVTNRFITFLNGVGVMVGRVEATTGLGVAYQTSGIDFAEYFTKDISTSFDEGDIVSLKDSAAVKADRENDSAMIGIVSASPGFKGGNEGPDKVLVGIVGQVPLKISSGSDPIKVGDLITSSMDTGRGKRANGPGFIIGKALESWSGQDKILVYVNPSWADPGMSLNSDGNIKLAGDSNNPGYFKLTDSNGNTVDKLSGLTALITNTFNALQGTVDNLLVKAGLVSPEVLTRDIKPLAGEKDINITLGTATESGNLAIKNANGEVAATIDSSGNATFGGQINSENASVSGALYANTIYADQIISKEGKFGDTSTNTLGGITREEIEDLLNSVEQNQNLVSQSQNWSTNTATSSAALNELSLKNLYVTGITALDSLSINNNVFIGGELAISKLTVDGNSILTLDTLDSPLSIQSTASQPLYIMAGKVKVDTTGNVQILGDLAVGGVLSASAINIAEDPNATVSGEILNSQATAGAASIASSSAELTIVNPNIKEDSLIFVTPTSKASEILYIKSKTDGSAVVGFTNPTELEVKFNWWIVNQINGGN